MFTINMKNWLHWHGQKTIGQEFHDMMYDGKFWAVVGLIVVLGLLLFAGLMSGGNSPQVPLTWPQMPMHYPYPFFMP